MYTHTHTYIYTSIHTYTHTHTHTHTACPRNHYASLSLGATRPPQACPPLPIPLPLGLHTILSFTILHGIYCNTAGPRGDTVLRNSVWWAAQTKVLFF